MLRLVLSSRVRTFVLGIFGPVTAIVVLVWAIPEVVGLIRKVNYSDSRGESSVPVSFSSVVDDAPRRNTLPVLRSIRTFGSNGDFRGMMHIAGVSDGEVVVVGDSWTATVDVEDGRVGPAVGLGHGADTNSLLGRIGRITFATMSPQSDIWVNGRLGFAKLDLDDPSRITRVVRLSDGAVPPVTWFGDTIVTASRTEFLRFYDVGDGKASGGDESLENRASVRRYVGEPLFPITSAYLSEFLNLMSLAVRSDQQRLAIAFRFSDRIHIYDQEGALVRAVASPVPVKLDFDILPAGPGVVGHTMGLNDETRLAYLSADADDDLIVALFSGLNRTHDDRFTGDELHVFRWDGALVGVWRLPESIVSVHVDELTRRIYGVRSFPFWSIVEFDSEPIYE